MYYGCTETTPLLPREGEASGGGATDSSNVSARAALRSLQGGYTAVQGVKSVISPGDRVEAHSVYTDSTGHEPLPSYQKVTPVQLPPFSESQ